MKEKRKTKPRETTGKRGFSKKKRDLVGRYGQRGYLNNRGNEKGGVDGRRALQRNPVATEQGSQPESARAGGDLKKSKNEKKGKGENSFGLSLDCARLKKNTGHCSKRKARAKVRSFR